MNTMDAKNTSIAAPKANLLADLPLVVADAGELFRVTASQAVVRVAVASALIQQNLQVVKDCMVAAEAAQIEDTLQAAKVTGQHVYDNHWNWY